MEILQPIIQTLLFILTPLLIMFVIVEVIPWIKWKKNKHQTFSNKSFRDLENDSFIEFLKKRLH